MKLSERQRQHLAAVARGGVTGQEFRWEVTFHDENAEGQDRWLDGRSMRSLATRGLVEWGREMGQFSFPVALTEAGRKALS